MVETCIGLIVDGMISIWIKSQGNIVLFFSKLQIIVSVVTQFWFSLAGFGSNNASWSCPKD